MRFQGGGSSHIQPTKMTNAIEAIREKGYQVTYIQGYQNEKEELGEKQLQDTIEKILKSLKIRKSCWLKLQKLSEKIILLQLVSEHRYMICN